MILLHSYLCNTPDATKVAFCISYSLSNREGRRYQAREREWNIVIYWMGDPSQEMNISATEIRKTLEAAFKTFIYGKANCIRTHNYNQTFKNILQNNQSFTTKGTQATGSRWDENESEITNEAPSMALRSQKVLIFRKCIVRYLKYVFKECSYLPEEHDNAYT